MSFIDNIINEFDIALKTLSNKKSGTSRGYPAEESPENQRGTGISHTPVHRYYYGLIHRLGIFSVNYKDNCYRPIC